MDDSLSERVWERKGISMAMERGRVAGCGRGEERRSGLGREGPVIHYSSPQNSDKQGGNVCVWGGGQRATAWKERTNEKVMRR